MGKVKEKWRKLKKMVRRRINEGDKMLKEEE